jgi:hypothetical protein
MNDDGQSRVNQRGPYGTNEGDMWLAPGSDVQDKLDAKGEGLILIHEMMVKDGELQECLYVTANPEMIAEATEGHKLWVAAQAMAN